MSKAIAVVPVSEFVAMQIPADDLQNLIRENIGSSGITTRELQRVKWPTGGNTFFGIETSDGIEPVSALDGVVIGWQNRRAWWKQDYSGKASVPDCYSPDGVIGVGTPGGDCDTCPLSQWGSDRKGGKGQDCNAMRLLFILRPNAIMPYVVQVPATSIAPISKYFFQLLNEGIHYSAALTRLSLSKAVSETGFDYAQAAPSMLARLSPDEMQSMRVLAESLKPIFNSVTVNAPQNGQPKANGLRDAFPDDVEV